MKMHTNLIKTNLPILFELLSVYIMKNKLRSNKFFETDFTKNVNVKKQRRFDRSTVIFKLESKNFCMRLKHIQSIIKMLMRYRLKL